MPRAVNIVLNVLSLILIGAGIAIFVTFFFPSLFIVPEDEASGVKRGGFDAPVLARNATPEVATGKGKPGKPGKREKKSVEKKTAYSPRNNTLTVSIPSMRRIEGDEIPTGDAGEEDLFRDYAAVHLEGTGYPWQKGANVYIAGHRFGYPGTESFLTFYDLNKLGDGDKILIRDANGRRYVYKVFREFVVGPQDVHVTAPVPGKSVLSLQTCTLPNYSQRLIVQAERVV